MNGWRDRTSRVSLVLLLLIFPDVVWVFRSPVIHRGSLRGRILSESRRSEKQVNCLWKVFSSELKIPSRWTRNPCNLTIIAISGTPTPVSLRRRTTSVAISSKDLEKTSWCFPFSYSSPNWEVSPAGWTGPIPRLPISLTKSLTLSEPRTFPLSLLFLLNQVFVSDRWRSNERW
jgi:hypothetical protein